MKSITSRDNPLVKRVRALTQNGRERKKAGQTILDGDHLVRAALEAGWTPEAILVSSAGLQKPEIASLIDQAQSSSPVFLIPDELMQQISPVATSAGLLALVATPVDGPLPSSGDAILLDQVQDAGNLGTLMRSACAAGILHVLLTPGCAQAWSPKVLRAAMGAHFIVSVFEGVDAAVWLAGYQGQVYATALGHGALDLYEADLTAEGAWLFGAEGAGLSPALLAMASQRLTIPMHGEIESLNVAAAAAVCLFEQRRQRLQGS